MKKLVAALGNPGSQYERSRHNIAWQMLEKLSFYDELEWRNKFKGEFAVHSRSGEKIFFLKPFTYMNRSGESIREITGFFKISIEDILVVHDELELDFGVAGFKQNGGLAGHNGLRSIAASLGTREFDRLRLGISRPAHRDITSYVLGNFSEEEQTFLPFYSEAAANLLELCLIEGFDSVKDQYKKKRLIPG
jgi:PTH1 family peptidyl-tRNA hydrolase